MSVPDENTEGYWEHINAEIDARREEEYCMKLNTKKARERHASALRDATIKYIEHGVNYWLRKSLNLDMWDMTTKDAYDLGCIVGMIEDDQICEAFEKASDLDTAVRDEIPTDTWNWLANARQERLRNIDEMMA